MTVTDPIANMLTRSRNASSAYHGPVNMPYLRMKVVIANILQTKGYIRDYQAEEARVGKTLVLNLKYDTKREHTISGVKRVPKPGLRVYAKSNKLPKVMSRLGVAIISLSSGLPTDREAAGKDVGGEIIAYIW